MIEHVRICLEQLEFGTGSLKQAIQGLSPEQLTYVPPRLENSIATLVLHIATVEVSIAQTISGKVPVEILREFRIEPPVSPQPTLPKAPPGLTVEDLLQKLEKARGILTEAVSGLNDEDLKRELPFFGKSQRPVSFFLNLLPFHLASHYGQIQLIKRLLG